MLNPIGAIRRSDLIQILIPILKPVGAPIHYRRPARSSLLALVRLKASVETDRETRIEKSAAPARCRSVKLHCSDLFGAENRHHCWKYRSGRFISTRATYIGLAAHRYAPWLDSAWRTGIGDISWPAGLTGWAAAAIGPA